jgi:hypothetical protein
MATHIIWGKGTIESPPIFSKMLQEDVVMFRPDSENFAILVSVEELDRD